MRVIPEADELSLIRQVGSGDHDALGALYDRYGRVMHALAYRMLGSVEEAEEVVTDAWLQAWRTADRFDPARGRVDSWLFLMTRSRALDRLRARERRGTAAEASKDLSLPATWEANGPETDLMAKERRSELLSALGTLPEAQRRAIELSCVEGYSCSEVALQLGEPLGTVKTRIRLGLSKLRDALGVGRPG